MDFLDLTLPTPEENLALDEALLLEAERESGGEVLRFWESTIPFVVVGVGGKVQEEVYLPECRRSGVPVLRRCSGGGTVVQGPGCLNYSLILKISDSGPLASIQGANQFIMLRNAEIISRLKQRETSVKGYTDLVCEKRKVSGNAQRRLKHHLLFHGTFLLNFDIESIPRLLPMPVLQPAYRQHRLHEMFVGNLGVSRAALQREMCLAWDAQQPLPRLPNERLQSLVSERYSQESWNMRR